MADLVESLMGIPGAVAVARAGGADAARPAPDGTEPAYEGKRYWDGSKWTDRRQPAQPQEVREEQVTQGAPSSDTSFKGGWDRIKEGWRGAPTWVKVGLGVFAAIVVLAAIFGEEEENGAGGTDPAPVASKPDEKQADQTEGDAQPAKEPAEPSRRIR